MKYPYRLIRSSRKTLSVEVKNGEVTVRSPRRLAHSYIDAFVESHRGWIERQIKKQAAEREAAECQQKLTEEELNLLKSRALAVIPERVRYYAQKMNVTYAKVTIRAQRTRWGSCSSKGNLNFNCLLVLMPPEVLDSVVVHELCHLKVMDHSPRFYNEVLKVYPEYYKWNDWLKKNGSRYISLLPER